MRVALCTISTDKYWDKYPKLKKSIDKHFLKTHDVKSYVYTDKVSDSDDVFYIQHLPTPLITLMKFNFLLQKQHVFKNFDLLYFIDGDCEIVSNIGEEIFPDKNNPIVVTKHPWQGYDSKEYDDNPKSTAYVQDNMGNHYLQACFFGGYTNHILNMSHEICELIKQDLKIRYIAKWFDESYMNKYLINRSVKLLDCGYAYPTTSKWNINFNVTPKILHDNNFSL